MQQELGHVVIDLDWLLKVILPMRWKRDIVIV